MISVWKYPLEITDVQTIRLPDGAVPLAAQMQGQTLCMWVKVDTNQDLLVNEWKVYIHGTGHKIINPKAHYVDTFQLHGGGLVFHVFAEESENDNG